MNTVVRIQHPAIHRGKSPVLGPGDLFLHSGSVVALVGVNGAGKTTLISTVSGFLRASAGTANVTINDKPVERIAVVQQDPSLPDWLTVRETARMYGVTGDGDGQCGSDSDLLDRKCSMLSDGQRQAVAVRLALAQRATLTLLDEPLSNIDIVQRPILLEAIRRARAVNPDGVIVISSHIASELEAVCGHVIVIRDGQYAFNGATADLVAAGSGSRQEVFGFEEAVVSFLR